MLNNHHPNPALFSQLYIYKSVVYYASININRVSKIRLCCYKKTPPKPLITQFQSRIRHVSLCKTDKLFTYSEYCNLIGWSAWRKIGYIELNTVFTKLSMYKIRQLTHKLNKSVSCRSLYIHNFLKTQCLILIILIPGHRVCFRR
jgi:hypothetical protein